MKKLFVALSFITFSFITALALPHVYQMSRWGISPDKRQDMTVKLQKALAAIRRESNNKEVVLRFERGTYHFYSQRATEKTYFISNHDQSNPKRVGFPLENFDRLIIEGNGAKFIFHGIMLPLSLLHSSNCTLKDFSIDFADPTIIQVQVLANDENGIEFQPASWNKCFIDKRQVFTAEGEGWKLIPVTGIAFEKEDRRVVYNTSDLTIPLEGTVYEGNNTYRAPLWKDRRLTAGTVVAMRNYKRPTPGIFLSHNKNTTIQNVKIHYAFGMGLLAQLCENISLDGFSVCLKDKMDERFFTTQADATHFSGCKGTIRSVNGLYEGMMDDAINVHGTYLKIISRVDDRTFIAKYMHDQSWGFDWGFAGDSVQFIRSKTMEEVDGKYIIQSITPYDKNTVTGAKVFKITLDRPVIMMDFEKSNYGMENLSWTPTVYFAHNIIRNNRARGALFSTPRKTIVEDNVFDHTSGTAILLCGDCNGWFETGACREVIIRHNKFINALTSMYQFTNAVISIYPEIPELEKQVKYFHGGKKGAIRIEENEFDVFDAPILYAKSVNGLKFRNNIIRMNTEYKAFHWNRSRFLLERVTNVELE